MKTVKMLLQVAAVLGACPVFAQVDELASTAAPSPTLGAQSVSVQGASLSASFEGGKDGKKLTGRGTLALPGRHFGGRIRSDLSIIGAEYDDQTNTARVLHAFDPTPGGTIALGLTWDNFDLRAQRSALKRLNELCAPHRARGERCNQPADLPENERREVEQHISDAPSVVLNLRGQVSAQYTKYFDPALNRKLDDLAWPRGFTVGAALFLTPRLLVGVTGGWKLLRNVRSPVQLCQNLPIGGATASPPVLTCSSAVVGAPSWKHELLGRFEVRQYLSGGLGWNPSISFAGPVDHGSFSFGNAWRAEVPVYFTFSEIKDKTLTVGAAYAHWRDDDGTFNDVSVFLAGGFGLLDSGQKP